MTESVQQEVPGMRQSHIAAAAALLLMGLLHLLVFPDAWVVFEAAAVLVQKQ